MVSLGIYFRESSAADSSYSGSMASKQLLVDVHEPDSLDRELPTFLEIFAAIIN